MQWQKTPCIQVKYRRPVWEAAVAIHQSLHGGWHRATDKHLHTHGQTLLVKLLSHVFGYQTHTE